MRLKSATVGFLLAAVAVVGYTFVSFDHRLTAQRESIEQQIARAERQAERLEAALRSLGCVAATASTTGSASATAKDDPRTLIQPPQRIHRPPGPSADVGAQSQPGAAIRKANRQHQDTALAAPQRGLAVAATFETESGSSAWGKHVAAELRRSYEAEPFFARFDATLKTDCRRTVCLVTWTAPPVGPSDPGLTMAKYELMALAAQREPQVSAMQSIGRTEKGRTVIDLYLSR